jgi:hypothetical protein
MLRACRSQKNRRVVDRVDDDEIDDECGDETPIMGLYLR